MPPFSWGGSSWEMVLYRAAVLDAVVPGIADPDQDARREDVVRVLWRLRAAELAASGHVASGAGRNQVAKCRCPVVARSPRCGRAAVCPYCWARAVSRWLSRMAGPDLGVWAARRRGARVARSRLGAAVAAWSGADSRWPGPRRHPWARQARRAGATVGVGLLRVEAATGRQVPLTAVQVARFPAGAPAGWTVLGATTPETLARAAGWLHYPAWLLWDGGDDLVRYVLACGGTRLGAGFGLVAHPIWIAETDDDDDADR